jgi:hypothetical protein
MLVSALAVALTADSITLFSGTEDTGAQAATTVAAGTTEVVLDDPNTPNTRSDRLLAAGETGFLHRQANVTGLLWTDYDDGGTVTVQGASGVYRPTSGTCYSIADPCPPGRYGQGADTVAEPDQYEDKVALWTPDGGAVRTVAVPDGYVGTYGSTVVLSDRGTVIDAEAVEGTSLQLVDFVDGTKRERWVTGYPSAEAA